MKFSIEGFDQNQLISLGCDIADAMILRWLVDFAHTGLMRTYINHGTTYYLVNYDAVLAEFPILGISTVKGIAKRFDRLVENGLLLKHIRHGASATGGTTVYFALTALVTGMLYSKISVPAKSIPEKNRSSVREVQTKAGEKNCGSFRLEPEFLSPGTGVPFALNNPSISNPSIKNSSANAKSAPELEKAVTAGEECHIVSKLKELFGGRYVFDGSFAGTLRSLQSEFEIADKDFKSYLDFVMAKTVEKKPRSITNMFYKMAQTPNTLQDFVLELKKTVAVEKETEAVCPVCGNPHANPFGECAVCNFDMYGIGDKRKIQLSKQIYALPADRKKAFHQEYASLQEEQVSCGVTIFQNEKLLQQFKQRFDAIYKKYGIIA